MEDLIQGMSRAMIEKAMSRILYGFEILVDEHDQLDMQTLLRMREHAKINPTISPVALIICVNYKKKDKSTLAILTSIIRALGKTGLVRTERIMQLHFERKPSNKNNIEVYIISQDD